MILTVLPLGYTNNNYLYNMVKNRRKINDTPRQITTKKIGNNEDILTTNTNDSITTDTPKVEDHSDTLALLGLVSLGIPIVLLLKWCLQKLMEKTSSTTERTPLLQDKPSDQSPPTDKELGLTDEGLKKTGDIQCFTLPFLKLLARMLADINEIPISS